jgi:hypothetical protein
METTKTHCPLCNADATIVFCGGEGECSCNGPLACLRCGRPLDYTALHDEASYWAELRRG